MKTRRFGKTNAMISEIGLGTWQLGTKWGGTFLHGRSPENSGCSLRQRHHISGYGRHLQRRQQRTCHFQNPESSS